MLSMQEAIKYVTTAWNNLSPEEQQLILSSGKLSIDVATVIWKSCRGKNLGDRFPTTVSKDLKKFFNSVYAIMERNYKTTDQNKTTGQRNKTSYISFGSQIISNIESDYTDRIMTKALCEVINSKI